MRVLIIGGTNFIGPYVVAALDRLGADITVYHRGIHEPDLPSSVRHVHSPRAAVPFLRFPPELTEPAPDVVLHMFPVGQDDARAAVARFAGVVQRLVAISSGDVYLAYGRLLGTEPGPPEPTPLKETAALRERLYPYRDAAAGPADWTYHYEKILVERAVRPYTRRMDDVWRAILLGTAQAAWRWTHGYVENVAYAIALTVLNQEAAGRVSNIGESSVPTMAERVRLIGHAAGWDGAIVPLPADRLPRHLRTPYEPEQDLVTDVTRFRTEMDFTDPVTYQEGLSRTIAWERSNPLESGDPGPAEYAAEDTALT
jgi:nucleoside-diphosphate-sugar epimerase